MKHKAIVCHIGFISHITVHMAYNSSLPVNQIKEYRELTCIFYTVQRTETIELVLHSAVLNICQLIQ